MPLPEFKLIGGVALFEHHPKRNVRCRSQTSRCSGSLAAAQAIVDLMHGKKPTHVVNGDVFQSAASRATMK